jgi:hypothetical protein
LYFSRDVIKVIKLKTNTCVGYVVLMRQTRNVHVILVRKPQGEAIIWEGRVERDLRKMWYEYVE